MEPDEPRNTGPGKIPWPLRLVRWRLRNTPPAPDDPAEKAYRDALGVRLRGQPTWRDVWEMVRYIRHGAPKSSA